MHTTTDVVGKDRFGNHFAPGLPYARGSIISSTEDDLRKIRKAWRAIDQRIRERGPGSVFHFSGLERSLPMTPDDLAVADDELAPALYLDRFRTAALGHLGGSLQVHDAVLFNRLTAATVATHVTLVKPGDVVVGVAPTYSHPTVVRAARFSGARFVDARGADAFAEVLQDEAQVSLVVLTRLAATYDLLPLDEITAVVRLAHQKRVLVYADDAGGARVGPAIFDQPRMLELGVDVGATGLDKYGTIGPRLGLLAGERSLVSRIYARGVELGLEARPMLYPAVTRSLEQYTPERVRALVASTKEVADALRRVIGGRLRETPVTAQIRAEDILEMAMERGGVTQPPIVPIEATAALAMLLLQNHGMLTVHFAGLPPGNSSFLIKFISPETLARFGGPDAFAGAVDTSLSRLGTLLHSVDNIRTLLF